MAKQAEATRTNAPQDKGVTSPSQVAIPLSWNDAKDLTPVLAQHANLIRLEGTYYLTFGQVQVPQGGGKPPSEVKIQPVAIIAVPEGVMKRLATFFAENLKDL